MKMKFEYCEDFPVKLIDEENETFQARLDYDSEEIQKLASDIAQFGQRNPIGLRKSPSNAKKFQIIYGFQRVKAIKILGQDTIKASIYDATDEECEAISVSDNLRHGDLTEVEKALKAFSLRHRGFEVKELCEMFGAKKSTIYNWFKVAKLDKTTRGCIQHGLITVYHGLQLARIEDVSRRLETLEIVISDEYSVRDLKRWIEQKRGPKRYAPLKGWISICPKVMKKMALYDCEKCEFFQRYGEIIREADEYYREPLRKVSCAFDLKTIPDDIREFIMKTFRTEYLKPKEPPKVREIPKETVAEIAKKLGLEKWIE